MITYRIEKKNSYRFRREVYNRFLVNEPSWHFFFEGAYMLLRVDDIIANLERWLGDKKIKYSVTKWVDESEWVRKYQDEFKDILHSYSELAMRVKPKHYMKVFERIAHCFYNMMSEQASKEKIAESYADVLIALNRARNEGYILAMQELKKK